MRDFAKTFYKSRQWQQCADSYRRSRNFICEQCKRNYPNNPEWWNIGEIVHHKIRLSESNINNSEISMNWDNLELLCRKCHAEEHANDVYHSKKRYQVRADGSIELK